MHAYDQGKARQAMEREALRDASRNDKRRRREERRRNKVRAQFAPLTTDELEFVREWKGKRALWATVALSVLAGAIFLGAYLGGIDLRGTLGIVGALSAGAATFVAVSADWLTYRIDLELTRRAQEIDPGAGSSAK